MQTGFGRGLSSLAQHLDAQDAERALINTVLDRSCELNDLQTCSIIADHYLAGLKGRARNVAKGIELLERAGKGADAARAGNSATLIEPASRACARIERPPART